MPPKVLWYRWFAKTYYWTPAQVRELDLEFFEWAPAIEAAEADAQQSMQRAEEASSRQARRR